MELKSESESESRSMTSLAGALRGGCHRTLSWAAIAEILGKIRRRETGVKIQRRWSLPTADIITVSQVYQDDLFQIATSKSTPDHHPHSIVT